MTFYMKEILEVKSLFVELNKEKIIENLSFKVEAGEILTILGPNGSGKTVLLKTLLGLMPYQKGEIIWKDNIKIGYLPQGLTPMKIRNLPLSVKDFFNLKQKNEKETTKALELVEIDTQILKKQLGDLSSGQFQRILFAWVLINHPNVLVFDEPTTGIDIGGEKTIYSLLYRFWKEKQTTIILVTHDLNVVYKYSTNVLCLHKGSLCCYGKPHQILTPQSLEKLYGTEIKFYKHTH